MVVAAFRLPDCVRLMARLCSGSMNGEDDDEESCCESMTTGERMSGCSKMFGALRPPTRSSRFSLVFDVFMVTRRRWSSSSSADGLIVTSGCSKMRSSLREALSCRPWLLDRNGLRTNGIIRQCQSAKGCLMTCLPREVDPSVVFVFAVVPGESLRMSIDILQGCRGGHGGDRCALRLRADLYSWHSTN